MTAPQPGDAVRVTITGTVTDWAKTQALIESVGGVVEDLTVVPPPLALGDTVIEKDYDRVPFGAVLDDGFGRLIFRSGQFWTDLNDSRYRTWELWLTPRTVVFLPNAA